MLKSLEKLILSGCSKLDELPGELGKMESLRVLHADGISVNQSLSTTSDRKQLSLLSTTSWHSTLWSWLSPTKTPRSTSFSLAFLPHSLVSLSLADCNLSDAAISYDLRSLPSLQYLNLSGNPFHSLPESINGLNMLQSLLLDRCTGLQFLPELPKSLTQLNMKDCTSLERVTNLPNLLRSLELEIYDCDKLVEVQDMFRLEPLRNIDIEMIRNLGLFNLESVGGIEVELSNAITMTDRKTPLQVLLECGILSIFLPGSDIPCWYNHRSIGPSISFSVPRLPGQKIRGLNLCTVYALSWDDPGDTQYAKVSNKTKGLKWTYSPIFYAIPAAKEEDMLWLSHWKFGDQLEGGDEVDVSVDMAPGFQVKMRGICLVYEPESKDTQSNSEEIVLSASPWYETLILTDRDLSAYQMGTDAYFLTS